MSENGLQLCLLNKTDVILKNLKKYLKLNNFFPSGVWHEEDVERRPEERRVRRHPGARSAERTVGFQKAKPDWTYGETIKAK